MEDRKALFQAVFSVPYHGIKKNSRPIFRNPKTGRSFLGKNERLKHAEEFLVLALRRRAIDSNIVEPIGHKVRGVFAFGFPHDKFYTKQLIESKKLPDVFNTVQIVADCLQKAGIIEDDRLIRPVELQDHFCSDSYVVKIELYDHR